MGYLAMKCFYFLSILIIGLVSVFDVYVSAMYDSLISLEENLVARHIIINYGVDNFIVVKSFTTIFVVILLFFLAATKYRIAILFVFVFQVALFGYLNTSFTKKNPPKEEDSYPILDLIQYWNGKHPSIQ